MNAVKETREPVIEEHQTIACLLKVADATEDAVDLMENILWDRLRAMRNRLYRLLSSKNDNVLLGACFKAYNDLPATQQARVLLSSEFCELYSLACVDKMSKNAPGEELSINVLMVQSRILDLILREQAIHELQLGRTVTYLHLAKEDIVYSPLGDVSAHRDAHGKWLLVQSPMLAEVVAIDFDSPVARNYEPRSGILSQPRLEFTDDEKKAVVEKLNQVLVGIDAVVPAYGFLIRNFVRRIIVRKSLDAKDSEFEGRVFGSEHVPRQPGSLRLLNTHLPELTADALMESILHESTHNFLAAWELANGPFVAHNQKDRPVSPWSGNGIPNSSFIHAAFIYYVCYRMYTRHLDTIGEDAARKAYICKRLAKFISGFMINHHTADQLVLKTPIAGELRDAIGEMQARIKAIHGYVY